MNCEALGLDNHFPMLPDSRQIHFDELFACQVRLFERNKLNLSEKKEAKTTKISKINPHIEKRLKHTVAMPNNYFLIFSKTTYFLIYIYIYIYIYNIFHV